MKALHLFDCLRECARTVQNVLGCLFDSSCCPYRALSNGSRYDKLTTLCKAEGIDFRFVSAFDLPSYFSIVKWSQRQLRLWALENLLVIRSDEYVINHGLVLPAFRDIPLDGYLRRDRDWVQLSLCRHYNNLIAFTIHEGQWLYPGIWELLRANYLCLGTVYDSQCAIAESSY